MNLDTMGWAIFGSFWLIAAGAAVLAVCLRLGDNWRSSRRYVLCAVSLLWPPLVLMWTLAFEPTGRGLAGAAAGWARPAGVVWALGAAVLALRVLGGWIWLRLLIRRAEPVALDAMAVLCRRMGVRRDVEVRRTGRADSPFTAGWLRPVIVVPAAVLAGLPADQMEAVLLHELAHIRRLDYVMEWAVQAVETVFYYHPAVWWMTAMVRRERERSCDEMVLETGTQRAVYARALVEMEQMRAPQLAAGLTGGGLRGRVLRILGKADRTPVWPVLLLVLVGGFSQAQTAWQKWLNEDVTYIIRSEEKAAFERLRTDEERTRFIEQFWERRDPTPGDGVNEFKKEHYRRINYASNRFPGKDVAGWKTDRGRIYIQYGPPDEIEVHTGTVDRPHQEKWLFSSLEGIGKRVIVEFRDMKGDGEIQMTRDPNGGRR